MVGGLINIVSYVSTDLYLTGAPQITFYKMVYRRYTNFAMESVYLDFVDNIKFGNESELVPPRIGDLLHKAYLHISIPSMSVTKNDVGIDTTDLQYVYINKSAVSNYEKIRTVYMKVMTDIYRIVYKAVNASNVTYAGLVRDVFDYVNSQTATQGLLSAYDALLLETREALINNNDPRESILDSTRSNLWYILTHVNVSNLLSHAESIIDLDVFELNTDDYLKEIQRLMKLSVFKDIELGFSFCKEVQKYFFDEYIKFTTSVSNDKNQNIRCAWVKNLGHSMIEYIDVYIGGKRIDRHWGVWIGVWHQLTSKHAQSEIYDRLIGNVEALTNFDNQEKPAYDMYVPLSFWFNKFNGLSFPLVAMQYNDLRINVKLRKFEEVFFIERIYKAQLNGSDVVLTADIIDFIQNRSENGADLELTSIEQVKDISLSDIWDDKGKQLHGHILMDYIYLESAERKRFAQSGHEYLIERVQSNEFDNVDSVDYDVRLDFTNPSKEMVWVFTKDCVTENSDASTGCRWYDHSLKFGSGNPVANAKLSFNNYIRIQKQDGIYFDKYQPYVHHRVTPDDGINMYSFCLDPTQHQPTGSCNFTRLVDVRLFMKLNDQLFRYKDSQIYPYDTDIDFKITITDPEMLLEQIDIDYVKRTIREYKLISADSTLSNLAIASIASKDAIKNFEDANSTMFVYEQLSAGKTIEISMEAYRRLLLKTKAKFQVFSLTMNILRLIGGYGALAYSGNN
ncbi:NCLDV major capsid protein [Yasminevirus sp. GU-2018]|uniref:NCLDV major capsid protein n=1 Tax=Yasminevirus sp. GU-2018 TaxID=2420051 RepID=A0A5K0U8T9_9VIRU|nr:NCLDV major capsid protein [Yasminevirus sp. GU-2018]